MSDKVKKLLALGGLAAFIVLVFVAIFTINFGSGTFQAKITPMADGKYPQWYCEKVKDAWDEGGWTERFGSSWIVSKCKTDYYNYSSWVDNPGSYNGPYYPWICSKVKNLWDEGGWTERFGSTSYPAACSEMYYTYDYSGGYTWKSTYGTSYDGKYTPWYCGKVKEAWDDGGWTERFGGTYDVSTCKEIYYTYDYSGGYNWSDSHGDYSGPYSPWICSKVKSLWDEGGWTERFGSIKYPSKCKEIYYTYDYSGGYNWNGSYNTGYGGVYTPEYCAKVKSLWEQGGWTERFGSTYDVSTCKETYYSYDYSGGYNWSEKWTGWDDFWWNHIYFNNFTYDQCVQIKELWDAGNWTAKYGMTYAPSTCKDQYFGYNNWKDNPKPKSTPEPKPPVQDDFWWNYISWDDFSFSQCYEIKLLWDNGDWTKKFGSVYAPAACGDKYFGDAWHKKFDPSEPPAGYEEEVPFSDIDEDSLEGKAAMYLYNIGVIGGYADGEFKGWRMVNRAEAAKFLLLARYGVVEDASNNGQFSDVISGEWYVSFVVKAAQLGIIDGYPDGTFKPAGQINRVEFLKMLAETFNLNKNMSYNFFDVDDTQWYAQYAGIADYYNLFPHDGKWLKPGNYMSRDEVAVALYKYLKY